MSRSIGDWLRQHDLADYIPVFAENAVDFKTLEILTDADLKELGLPFGPRKRILSALASAKPSDSTPPVPTSPKGERRQLTVLFCDMIGFTDLASGLDPEVLQAVMRAYEEACTECVTRFGGYVFQRLGDGIVAFFGVPLAHEGEAERAIRAGLLIVDRLSLLEVPAVGRIHVRVGIATGVVVVSLSDNSAAGETMNLASRLQALAEPDSLIVSESVRRMAAHAFMYVDLGEQTLKGIARPTQIYRVVKAVATASRFEAARGDALTPLVGREEEIEFLSVSWKVARAGHGQVALLSGEPGIGKSRIVSALRGRLQAEGVAPLLFQCSPYYANSAFYPIIDYFERELRFESGETAAAKLDKLEGFVVRERGRPLEDARFLAAILSIPCEDRYGPATLTAKRQKEQTIVVLVNLLAARTRAQPGLLLFEDLHWADPTTLEVIDALIGRIDRIPMLAVLTHRPEFQSHWAESEHLKTLHLGRLTPKQSGTLVARLTDGKALPEGLLNQIVRKTDGVPLFLEELTKSILEIGTLKVEGGNYEYAGSPDEVVLPATLRDLLMARLDRVKEVKEVAQIGATIGRDFSYQLISAVAPMGPEALESGLHRLVASGLAFQRGEIPGATYTFKHALVQDAAYDSLLKSRRKELHGAIARVIEGQFPGTKETEPELLAQHFTEAGMPAAAVPYWRRAGELARQRFALAETLTHFRKGLAAAEALPAGPERDLEALTLRCLLAPSVVAQRGWAAPEVGRILSPAWELALKLEHRASYLPILHGLWVHYMCRGLLRESLVWAELLLSDADGDLVIVGHRAASASYFWLGDFLAARRHGDSIRATYDAKRHWHIAPLTNADPLTGEGIYRGQYFWMLGYPEQAVAITRENADHARRRNHPFDLAMALTLGVQAFDFRYEPGPLLQCTEEAERVGRERGVPLLSEVMCEVSKGIVWLREGRIAESVGQLRDAIARLSATGHGIWIHYLQALLAEALARSGALDEAAEVIDSALARFDAAEERGHYAEVLRLKGWLLMQQGRGNEAETWLRRAIEIARQQQARSWELRAAMALARLLAQRGDRVAARETLAPVYAWFTEGFDTHDLKEAKALLSELAA